MSRENVELVRGAWAAVERGDLETALEIHAPDIEIDLSTGGRADAGVYRGREETTRAYETWVSPWESMVMEAKEFIDAADDQLVVHFEARPLKADGPRVRTRSVLAVHAERRPGREHPRVRDARPGPRGRGARLIA
jgi:ketosteroid isomerase-like protein